MGCDIHGVIQVRDVERLAQKWETVAEGYAERNYAIFAILADVRNLAKDPYAYISLPKGLPKDFAMSADNYHPINCDFVWLPHSHRKPLCFDETDEEYGVYWMGEHSYSHLTAEEIFNYDWQKTFNKLVPSDAWYVLDGSFFLFLIQLTRYSMIYGAQNVRFVFGFDN